MDINSEVPRIKCIPHITDALEGNVQWDKLGIYKSQVDPGWWVLLVLKYLGLAWDIKLPEDLSSRPNLKKLKSIRIAGTVKALKQPE